jgi:hypothetical protein
MKGASRFRPRDEREREAFAIEPPKFDIGEAVEIDSGGRRFQGRVTDIYCRTVDWPLWLYQIDGGAAFYDPWQLRAVRKLERRGKEPPLILAVLLGAFLAILLFLVSWWLG